MSNSIIEAQKELESEELKEFIDNHSLPPLKKLDLKIMTPRLQQIDFVYLKKTLRVRFGNWLLKIVYKIRGEDKTEMKIPNFAKFINVGKPKPYYWTENE